MLRTIRRTRLIGAYAVMILAVAFVGCGGGDSPSPVGTQETSTAKETSAPSASEPAAPKLRTVLVYRDEPSSPSPSPMELNAGLETGRLPDSQVKATVLTDEDCAPDAEGISHCRNVVRLASGNIVVLRHPHEMHMVPCLEPGEQVLLRPAAA